MMLPSTSRFGSYQILGGKHPSGIAGPHIPNFSAFFSLIRTYASSSSNPNPNSNPNHHHALTSQQEKILSAVADGRSIFITGSAGTGKTSFLRVVIQLLHQIHSPSSVFVTASTGVAACSIAGQTLHSFAGIGVTPGGDLQSLLSKLSSNGPACCRWARASALVIDEISMIDGELFDSLDQIARKMRPWASSSPWGGIQLIVTGDFFQLPPIKAPNTIKEFAFEADCWDSSFNLQVELTRIFRQSDSALIKLLQSIRRGQIDDHQYHLLLQCGCSYSDIDDNITTRLFPMNEDVRKVNTARLESLGRETVTYQAVDKGKGPWKARLNQGIAPEELEICEGARVMLIKNTNIGYGLVNGATGTVTGFVSNNSRKVKKLCRSEGDGVLPRIRFDTGVELVVKPEKWDLMEGENVRAARSQIPLILAWALSIHKCQGMTLGSLYTDLSRAFGCGMVYVALSRVRSLAGLRVSGLKHNKIKAHPKVLHFYDQLLLSKKI